MRIYVFLVGVFFLGCVLLGVGARYYSGKEDVRYLTIMTAQEVFEAEAIHGSHVVRQRIGNSDSFLFSRLEVPMFIQESRGFLDVEIITKGQALMSWRRDLSDISSGMHVLEFVFDEPLEFAGSFDVVFSSDVPNAEFTRAPLLFIEKADDAYPDGNYAVGENEKRGDVGLVIYASVSRAQIFWQEFIKKPFDVASRIMLLVFIASVVLVGIWRAIPRQVTRL